MGEAVRFPGEDVMMRADLRSALERVRALERALGPDDSDSPAARQAASLDELRHGYEHLRLALDTLRAVHAAEHARLCREAEQAVARITADGQLLDHLRELIRFFKSA